MSSASGATSSTRPEPEPEVDRLDALGLQPSAHLDLGAEERPVRLDGRVEILDGEGDVVHGAHVHATDPSDWSSVGGARRREECRPAPRRSTRAATLAEERLELGADERLLLEQRRR